MADQHAKRRPKQFKTPVICDRCCAEGPRRSNSQIYCSECADVANREKNRANEERKRRATGIIALGSTVKCSGCGADYVRVNGAQKDCPSCVASRKDDANRLRYEKYEKGRKRVRNGEADKARSARWISNNKNKRIETCRKYYERNRDSIRHKSRLYNQKEEVQARRREYEVNKRATDPKYRLNCAMKAGLRRGLLDGKGGQRWEDLAGYSLESLSRHLERQFDRAMSWDNYGDGGWHVDHIRPLDAYEFTTTECEDFKAAWALSNLRPL